MIPTGIIDNVSETKVDDSDIIDINDISDSRATSSILKINGLSNKSKKKQQLRFEEDWYSSIT